MKIEKTGGTAALLTIAWLGNLIDTVATVYLHSTYGYMEGNPVMAWLLQWPFLFVAVKIVAMTMVVVWMWLGRSSIFSQIAAYVAAIIYGAIALYYMYFSVFLL